MKFITKIDKIAVSEHDTLDTAKQGFCDHWCEVETEEGRQVFAAHLSDLLQRQHEIKIFLSECAGSEGDSWPAFLRADLKNKIESVTTSVVFDAGDAFGGPYAGPTLNRVQLIFSEAVTPDSPSQVARFYSVSVGYCEGYQIKFFRDRAAALASSGDLRRALQHVARESETITTENDEEY